MPDFGNAPPQKEPSKPLDREDIKNRVLGRMHSFVRWLYAERAIIKGIEARIGNTRGEKGTSLSINLRSGQWFDHATQEGGDMFDLVMALRPGALTFPEALEEVAREFLNDPVPYRDPSRKNLLKQWIEEDKKTLGNRPHSLHQDLGWPVASWKFKDLEGNIIASVERYEPASGKTYRPWCFKKDDAGKTRWVMGAPEVRPLYNLASVAQSSHVVLVEGEKCADALIGLGIVATTAMQGAGAPIDKTDWSHLRGKSVTVWPDNDKPGLDYGQRVGAHLSQLGCLVTLLDPTGQSEGWDAADCVAEGKDVQEFLRGALQRDPDLDPDFPLVQFAEMGNRPQPRLMIDKAIPHNSFGVIWGPSQSYKTFLVLDLVGPVVHGIPWHGHEVFTPGPVLYCAEEDPDGVYKRAVGWHSHHELPHPGHNQLVFHFSGMTLVEKQENIIRAAIKIGAVLIVVETLARVFGNGDENKTMDMVAFVNACERIRFTTGATVILVHHSGLNETRERGNASLRAACDFVFKVERVSKNGNLVRLVNDAPDGKQKNMAPLKTLYFEMRPVSFQFGDNPGERTLVPFKVDREDNDEESKPIKRGPGPVQRAILRLVEEAGIPLSRADLREHFRDMNSGNFSNTVKKMVADGLLEEVQIGGEIMLRLNSR